MAMEGAGKFTDLDTLKESLLHLVSMTTCPGESLKCEKCGDLGWMPREGTTLYEWCDCSIEPRIHGALPEQYHDASLKDFSKALQTEVLRWRQMPAKGLFITGLCGTGKTHLAAALVRSRMEQKASALFRRASKLFRQFRDSYKREIPEECVLGPYESEPFLVVDDLGGGSGSDHERRIILDLLDARIDENRLTVVTSNCDIERFREWDDRIASRLSTLRLIVLSGADRRLGACARKSE
jgi:hypothetical protein